MRKPETRATIRTVITAILIIAIIVVFYMYSNTNKERIARQNASYLESSTVQTAERIDDILQSARYSIRNLAKLYGRTLTGAEVNTETLRDMADGSLFDYVDFIDADGIDINVQGVEADVSDRSYFINGMKGESGMDGTYTSRITNERLVIFYAPVEYEGEIIGVLTGHYLEERMNNILETTLFDEQVPSFLCLSDGTVISRVGSTKEEGENVLDYLDGRIDPGDRDMIVDTLANEERCSFTCVMGEGETMAYMVSLSGNSWTLLQLFPVSALSNMEQNANSAGMILEAELIVLFIAYLVLLMLQEWYQRKRLLREKQQAESIIEGINRLFARFILVNLEEDTYQYVNDQAPSFQGFPSSGTYSDFLVFFRDKFLEEHDLVPMSQVLTGDYIREHLTDDVPFENFEYQIQRGDEKYWENMSIIVLQREEGHPTVVLLAVQEITGLKKKELQTQTALKEAYQAAEAANRAKSEFLSRMSHDIRTPMNAIMGMTAIAAMHIDDKARVEDCLTKITSSSRHLLGLINEVLDMSKIESGKLDLVDEEFDLSETVDDLLGLFHTQIEAKEQVLSVTLEGITHEKVIGDSQRLSQVLVNIMGNAVKFTPPGGSISLCIRELPSHTVGCGCYEFIFTDTGIGMKQEFVEKMFEPFVRASDSRTGKIEGTGLGMPIARNIVRMMNGDIQVKSKEGVGTQITATVMLRYVTNAEEELSMLAGYRVMVVDDEQMACENACSILSSINMPSDWFTDADEAIEALVRDWKSENSYTAVILDWKMPKKDGVQVTREIRSKIGEEIPIIILSAYDWSAIEKEAVEAGVNAFIAKPLFKSRLVYVMKKVLLRQNEEEEKPSAMLMQEEQFADKRVLIVEDNELNMEIAEEILTTAGFRVDKAFNGKEAVDRLTSAQPGTYQVVLMDIQMPVMNGYEATEAVRNSEREDLRTLPIIAMTADAFSDDVKKSAEAGMNGHIAKPIDISVLMETLKEWVQ